jgi:hypothetical protein
MPFTRNPSPLPFAKFAARASRVNPSSKLLVLEWFLSSSSIAEYRNAFPRHGEILEFKDHGFTYLFDLYNSPEGDDRVIAVYGQSRIPSSNRDSSRQQGFCRSSKDNPKRTFGKGLYDKGHFMAHSIGGGMDVNFFPQNPPLNRGQSDPGRQYREMELEVAATPGTFVFARPIYTNETWVPTYLEYAVLRSDGDFWSALFLN